MMLQLMLVLVMLLTGAFQVFIFRQTLWFSRSAHMLYRVESQKMLGDELLAEGVARLINNRKIIDELNTTQTIQIKQVLKLSNQNIQTQEPENKKTTKELFGILRFTKISDTRYTILARLFKQSAPNQALCSRTASIDYDTQTHEITINYDA